MKERIGGAYIPVVVLVGDDYQLPPPTNREKGAFDTMDSKSSWSQQHFSKTGSFEHQLFTDMSQVCMELTMVKRQNSSQLYCKELLGHLRIGQTTEEDAKYLMALHLGNLSANDTEQVLNNGTVMHLFATKAPRNDHNYKCISRISSSDNPVAMVKAQWSSTTKKKATAQADHFQNPPPSATLLCRGAMVRIVTRNFEPKWGLYTNAIGTIKDIVYEDGKTRTMVTYRHYMWPPTSNIMKVQHGFPMTKR